MDHSVTGYLKRQKTQKLKKVLADYEKMENSQMRNEIIHIIQKILGERRDTDSV